MLNFNVDPYYDDFDPNKNYYRVLYKPGRAVQARELTQSQTILQNQITNFADHFFTQNTPIKGGKITVNLEAQSLKLNPTYNEADVVASDFLNQIITDDTATIVAKVIATEEATSSDPPTLFLTYFSGSTFANGSNVISTTTSTVAQASSTDAAGRAALASISNGVFYIVNGYNFSSEQNQDGTFSRYSIGHFVDVQPQTIVLEKYNNTPNSRIGLEISEFISDYVTDPSLLDPAVGATNYQAPGADRYTINLNLTSKSLVSTGTNDQNFIELCRTENGKIIRQVNGTTYSAIDDYFAKRTYETNGDYIVSPFKISASANTSPAGGNQYLINIGPGTAYVQGYRTENQSQTSINANRARTTSNVNNNVITPSYGNYFFVNTLQGANGSFIDATAMNAVDFHVGGVANINTQSFLTYSSTVAATGYVRNFIYSSTGGTDANSNSYIYKAHVFNLTNKVLSSNTSAQAASSITFYDTTGKFSTKANVYDGVILTVDSGVGAGQRRKVVGYNGTTKTAYVDTAFSVVPNSSSTLSLRFETKDIEAIVRANTVPTSPQILGHAAINNLGKVGQISTGDTVLVDADEPQLIFQIGNPYVASVSDTSYTSLQEYRGQSFSVGGGGVQRVISIDPSATSILNFIRTGAAESADSIKQNFIVLVTDPLTNANLYSGQILSFTNSPTRTVSVDASKTTVTLTAQDLLPFTATVFTKVNVINAGSTNFVLKQKTLVTANTTSTGTTGASGTVNSANLDLTKGQYYLSNLAQIKNPGVPQSLYVSDVKRIVKIIDTKGESPTIGMYSNPIYDVTNNYIFNNGQRDSYYGHATITLRPGAPKPKALWVFFDHYQTTGGDGYYSKQSYINENYAEIPSHTASDGTVYELRDCIDFRPLVKNLQDSFVFRYSVEPNTSNFYGSLLPQDGTNFTCDYNYYLGRKDLLLLTKDSVFQVLQGTPAVRPSYPARPTSGLVIAEIDLDPYTAYVPGENNRITPNLSIKPIQHKNWLMKDITNLQERINYIQYYSALSLLEQSSLNLQIQDSEGLNRFKNGILVDDFSTYTVADTFNEDYSASIDVQNNILTAAQDVDNFQLQNLSAIFGDGNLSVATQTSLGYRIHRNGSTSVVSLPISAEQVIVSQKLASRDVDVNSFSVRNTQGTMLLTPPMDNWIDTSQEPALLFVDPTLRSFRAFGDSRTAPNLLQVGNWAAIPGTWNSQTERSTSGFIDTYTTTTTLDYSRNLYYGNYTESSSVRANYITDVSLQPYLRSQQLQFVASNLLNNTNVNAFFDEKRVTRLVKKPNIINLTSYSGTFEIGDLVGYLSSGNFIKTGKIIDIYRQTSNWATSIRLYVSDDNDSSVYSSSSTLIVPNLNGSGNYVSTKASGTIVSTTHYSGKLSSSQTNVSTVTLNTKASSSNTAYVGLSFNIVGVSTVGVSSVPKGSEVKITAYNGVSKVATLDGNISFESGDIYSIGPLQTNEIGKISGIFYLIGGYFPAGERIFRIDNRIVTQTATEFVYSTGTETTFAEAKFIGQGLLQKTQELEFSSSFDTASGVRTVVDYDRNRVIGVSRSFVDNTPSVPESSGCCVIATALEQSGVWSNQRKEDLVIWCEKYLHNKSLGECFRRGYQVLGSKIGVPVLKGSSKLSKYLSKYYIWSWNNGTNMALGKKFNPASIPNSLFWIIVMMSVGSVVTKEYAEKTWKKLYENS